MTASSPSLLRGALLAHQRYSGCATLPNSFKTPESAGRNANDKAGASCATDIDMSEWPDENDFTPDRLRSLLNELNAVTTEAAHLHDAINDTIAQAYTEAAVDDAARSFAPDGDEPHKTEQGK